MHRHETDAISLAFGIIFVIVGGLFVSGRVDGFDFVSIWALPGALFAIGLVLASVALSRHRGRRIKPQETTDMDWMLE